MSGASWPGGVDLIEFAEIDSTNAEARRMAEAGHKGPVWIRSDVQSAGRGRRGRSWVSPEGNLFATLLVRPNASPADAALLSFVAALAVAETLDAYVDTDRVRLKWPNDVQLDGKKTCGTLLESAAGAGGQVDWLAVGIGINLASHPLLDDPVTTSLGEAMGSPAPPPQEALTHLARRFAAWFAIWQREGFAPVRKAWLARARGLGQPIIVNLPHERLEGLMGGIDESGALLLETEGGIRRISAGEVFFGS